MGRLNFFKMYISVHLTVVFGDKLVDLDISGGRRSGGNSVSGLVSDEVRTKMMTAIPGVPGEDYPILSSEVSDPIILFGFLKNCQFQALSSVVSTSQFSCADKEFGG